jgi:hypothetical protein
MGDDPADILGEMFTFHAQVSGRKPRLREVLDALAHILRSDGSEIVANPELMKGRQLLARLASPDPPLVSRAEEAPVDELLLNLAVSLREVAEAYEQSGLSRKPRLSEILEAFTAVLCDEPQRYLSEAGGLRLEAFTLAN